MRLQLPFLTFRHSADYFKDGQTVRRKMKATDASGAACDLAALNPIGGSIVRVLCTPLLWASALSKGQAALSLQLDGIQIIKLQTLGAGRSAGSEAMDDDDMALAGDFEADDLSGYAPAAAVKEASSKRASSDPRDDFDDEIPF